MLAYTGRPRQIAAARARIWQELTGHYGAFSVAGIILSDALDREPAPLRLRLNIIVGATWKSVQAPNLGELGHKSLLPFTNDIRRPLDFVQNVSSERKRGHTPFPEVFLFLGVKVIVARRRILPAIEEYEIADPVRQPRTFSHIRKQVEPLAANLGSLRKYMLNRNSLVIVRRSPIPKGEVKPLQDVERHPRQFVDVTVERLCCLALFSISQFER